MFVAAVDEQNAQTEQQLKLLQDSQSVGSVEHLDIEPTHSLSSSSETSRSAPTFSIFTSEAAPKPPVMNPRRMRMYLLCQSFPHKTFVW